MFLLQNVKQRGVNMSRLLHSFFFYLNSHITVIEALTASNPRLLFTSQLYTAPLSSPVRFVRFRVSDVDSKIISPIFVHVMSGWGLPVALQKRVKSLPSNAV